MTTLRRLLSVTMILFFISINASGSRLGFRNDTGFNFNREFTGVYFNRLDLMGLDSLSIYQEGSYLSAQLRRIHTRFDKIMIDISTTPGDENHTENYLVPAWVAMQNLGRENMSANSPTEVIVLCYIDNWDWDNEKMVKWQLRKIKYYIDRANSIYPGTVKEIVLNMFNLSEQILLKYQKFVAYLGGTNWEDETDSNTTSNSSLFKYRFGLLQNITQCVTYSSSGTIKSPNQQIGPIELLYFSHDMTHWRGNVLAKDADIGIQYLALCKRLLESIPIRKETKLGFMPIWQETNYQNRNKHSRVVDFWRKMDGWAGDTNTSLILSNAFENPFQATNLQSGSPGWWQLATNSSHLSSKELIFEEKADIHGAADTLLANVNMSWLQQTSVFSSGITGVEFEYVIKSMAKQHNGSSPPLTNDTPSVLIQQVSKTFSKLFLSPRAPHENNNIDYFTGDVTTITSLIPEIVANSNRIRSNISDRPMEVILAFDIHTASDVIRWADTANRIFPTTVKQLIFQPSTSQLGNASAVHNLLLELNGFNITDLFEFGITIPFSWCHRMPFSKLLFNLQASHNLRIIMFSAVITVQQSNWGFDGVFPLFLKKLDNCKQIVADNLSWGDMSKVDVAFTIGWPIVGEENFKNMWELVNFWEQMNKWADETNTTVIFKTAFNVHPFGGTGAGASSSVTYGWWRQAQNGTVDDQTFVSAKEVLLRLYLDLKGKSKAYPNAAWTTLEMLVTVLAIALISICISVTYITYKREGKLLTKSDIAEFFNDNSDDPKFGMDGTTIDFDGLNCPEILKESFSVDKNSSLGSGEFGKVYKGSVGTGEEDLPVAVKMTKTPCPWATMRGFRFEIRILSYLGKHPNIVELIGACTADLRKNRIFIFLEQCTLGSLQSYLRKLRETEIKKIKRCSVDENDTDLAETTNELVDAELDISVVNDMLRWSREIVCGMTYIASKHVVHMDLATRNVLLTSSKQAKITDFGLSRRLYNYTSYVKKTKEPLPWRSMAPESLRRSEFTEKSDVWAFGVTLWEIFSLGNEPYPGLAWDPNFPTKLERGLTLDEPSYNPDNIYSVMLPCWEINPSCRPTFAELSAKLYQTPYSDVVDISSPQEIASEENSATVDFSTSEHRSDVNAGVGYMKRSTEIWRLLLHKNVVWSTLAATLFTTILAIFILGIGGNQNQVIPDNTC